MIQCAFCSISKSQKYLLTQCSHLICLNCASLRLGQGLKCCNIITKISQQVRQQLLKKKFNIMQNLQNQYNYQKTDLDRIEFQQLERGLSTRNQCNKNLQNKNCPIGIENKSINQYNLRQSQQDDIMKDTPINQFYRSPLILNQKFDKLHQQATPIKRISTLEDEDPIAFDTPNNKLVSFNKIAQQLPNQKQLNLNKVNQQNNKNLSRVPPELISQQFTSILEEKIQSVRKQFKNIYSQLEKKQATIVYQLKIYFEQYMRIVQKQRVQGSINRNYNSSQEILQKERISLFLNSQIEKWNLKQIKNAVLLPKKQQNSGRNSYNLKDENNFNSQKQQSRGIRLNQNALNSRQQQLTRLKINDINKCFQNQLEQLQLKQKCLQQVKDENLKPCQTGRNLQKIYKKLQQSRTKLQQRIIRHNWFMSQRCNMFNRV